MTAAVVLGRAGDCINCLPCIHEISRQEGKPCAVIISEPFAGLLDGCSYVKKAVVPYGFTDVIPALTYAHHRYDRVLCARVSERSMDCESFNQQQWKQLGMLDKWDSLPLVFDQRDPILEEWQFGHFKPPFALYNMGGKSSPVPNGERWIQRHHKRICPHLEWQQWIDLSKITAKSIYDLLWLFDRADALVTGDTATLHLAAASKVPTVNLIQDKPTRWHGSKPRNNSIAEIRYSDLDSPNLALLAP